jgi:hypothetical protein
VLYKEDSTGSSISCVFLNQSDTSEKICCVTYGPCDQKELGSDQTCNRDSPYNIQLEVDDRSSQTYCYIVTASSDTYTVKVEGTLNIIGIVISNNHNFILIHDYNQHSLTGDNRRGNSNTAAITAGVAVPVVFILVLLGTAVTVSIVWDNRKKKKKQTSQTDLECIESKLLAT